MKSRSTPCPNDAEYAPVKSAAYAAEDSAFPLFEAAEPPPEPAISNRNLRDIGSTARWRGSV